MALNREQFITFRLDRPDRELLADLGARLGARTSGEALRALIHLAGQSIGARPQAPRIDLPAENRRA